MARVIFESPGECRDAAASRGGSHRVYDSSLLVFGYIARAWQAYPSAKQVFGDISAVALRLAIQRLQVHGFPQWTAFNLNSLQGKPDFFPIRVFHRPGQNGGKPTV